MFIIVSCQFWLHNDICTEAALQRCSQEKMLLKNTANLQENILAKVRFQ